MFYDKFKQLCTQKGVSCNRAAAEIGLSNATPTSWKKRGLTPKGDTLTKIADYFGVTTDYLLSDGESSQNETNNPLANAIFNASRATSITPAENAAIANMVYDTLTNKKAPTQTDGRKVSDDEIKAAFFEGADDLTAEEMDAMWQDAQDYVRYKLEQRRKRNG